MSSVFSGIERAEVYSRAQHIRPGLHRIRVDELIVKKSSKSATFFFVLEATIVSSTGGRPTTAKELPPEKLPPLSEAHKPGDQVSWVLDCAKPNFLSNVKGFALALAPDLTDADVTEAGMVAMCNQDPARGTVQPCAGILVDADAFMILTKGKGEDFTTINWVPVDPGPAAD